MIGAMRGVVDGPTHDENMILSCCPVVLCKLGQKSDMKNGDFLPYFYPLFHIQYRFCGPRVNLRLAYELAKTIPTDFSHSAPVVGIKKAKNHLFPLGLMKQKSCHITKVELQCGTR